MFNVMVRRDAILLFVSIVACQVEEYADEIFDALDKGAHIYFCGLKGMMPGIQVRTSL